MNNNTQTRKASYGFSDTYSLTLFFMCKGIPTEIVSKSVNLKTFIPDCGRAALLPQHTRSVISNGMVLGTQYPSHKVSTPTGTVECYAKMDDALSDAECVRDYITERLAFENLSTDIVSYWTFTTETDGLTFKGADIVGFKVLLWKFGPNQAPALISSM